MSREEQLIDVVLGEGILRETSAQRIYRVDGSTSRWMLDSLQFSLTQRGAQVAARALLRRLARFEARQLATFGLTGVPLMQAVIAESKGRYSGLLVRKEVKTHGARQRIQGPRGGGPVVILDDSVASGSSIRECRKHLEEHGLEVEGAVVLVRFGYDGVASLLEDGLPVEAVLDTETDLRPRMAGEELMPLNPGKVFPAFKWKGRCAERLHPAVLARQAIASYLRDGTVPRPPRALDETYDGEGGVFVSLRRRSDIHDRPARAGFWHFPEEPRGPVPRDLLEACVLTAQTLKDNTRDPLQALADCAIAVTFFSRLEPCTLGALDNDRYGIVVRSRERRGVMGGALPRMPGIRDGWAQFRHAAWKNAQLYARERYELLRHGLTKRIEPGAQWQPTGVPKPQAAADEHASLVKLALKWTHFHLEVGDRPRPSNLALDGLAQVFLSPTVDGAVIGCAGDHVRGADPDALFDRLAQAAVRDSRFKRRRPASADAVAVVLSLLRLDLELGEHPSTTVMAPTKFASQVLEVRQGDRSGILLPYVAVTHDLDPQQYADAVVAKAGLTHGPLHWTRYDCASWVASAGGERRLVDGLPERPQLSPAKLGRLWADFLERHSTLKGPAVNRYLPFEDTQLTGAAPARLAHSAWVKARLGRKRAAAADLERAKADVSPSTLAFTALARGRSSPALRALVTDRVAGEDQEYAPGQVLYALGNLGDRGVDVRPALAHYRRQFRVQRAWGSVAWLTMAFGAWSRVLREVELLDFAWELTAWALEAQATHGGFWNNHQPDAPGALTAVYLEGFAALLPELKRDHRTRAAAQLQRALDRGFRFLGRLTYQPCDAPILPNPDFAVGGVRMSLTSGEVRLDFVQHALSAVLFL